MSADPRTEAANLAAHENAFRDALVQGLRAEAEQRRALAVESARFHAALHSRSRRETAGVRVAGVLIAAGLVLALCATTAVLILTGIAALVAGVALAFRYGVTTGRWEA